MEFKDKLKLLRMKREWTQQQAADSFGVRLRTYQYWESGREPENEKAVGKLLESLMK